MSMVDTCHFMSVSTHIMHGVLVIRVVAVVLPVSQRFHQVRRRIPDL